MVYCSLVVHQHIELLLQMEPKLTCRYVYFMVYIKCCYYGTTWGNHIGGVMASVLAFFH